MKAVGEAYGDPGGEHLARLVRDHKHTDGGIAASALQSAEIGGEEKLRDQGKPEEGPQRSRKVKEPRQWAPKDSG